MSGEAMDRFRSRVRLTTEGTKILMELSHGHSDLETRSVSTHRSSTVPGTGISTGTFWRQN
jgi:hypothetical protein